LSLTRKIGILLSLLLLLLLGSVLALYYFKSERFFQANLERDARETARTLALSLQADMHDANRTRALVDTAFARGIFRRIDLTDVKSGRPIYVRTQKEHLGDIPAWFVSRLKIPAPKSEKIIHISGDRFIRLTIETDRSAIYRQMYDLFIYTVLLFVGFGILGLLAINLTLRVVLHSLEQIKSQAEGVIHNRFIIQKELPATPELKNVVLAMNSMVKRVKELYKRSSETMRQSQEMLYLDEITGLYNRRYFRVKLPEYLLAGDTRSRGTLTLIRLGGVVEGNRRVGRKRMDELLHAFALLLKEAAEQAHEPLVCRINGTEFALVLPMFNTFRSQEIGENLIGRCLLLAEQYGVRDLMKLSIGLCEYERKVAPGKLLSCADSALREASMHSESRVVVYRLDTTHPIAGKDEWRHLLERAMKEGRLKPRFAPVFDLRADREIAYLLSFDLVKEEGGTIGYADYIPAVVELGLEEELMRYIFGYMKQHPFSQRALAFEMVADMLHESDKLFFFEDSVKEIKENLGGRPLFVEIAEHDILSLDPVVVERFSFALKKLGVRLGIQRFNGERGEYGYLKYSAPAYVKMSESSFRDLDAASRNALLTLLGSLDIQLIVVDVQMENVAELKESLVRYIMYRE